MQVNASVYYIFLRIATTKFHQISDTTLDFTISDLKKSTNGMNFHLRVAKPVTDLAVTQKMYCSGLNLSLVGHFEDHDGFSGIMLGSEEMQYHFEFTVCHNHAVVPASTPEDLIVLYIPNADEFRERCENMVAAGFRETESFNPYWSIQGRTFQDLDGYRIVLQNDSWSNTIDK